MHHFGEGAVQVEIKGFQFFIYLQNHTTGAVITISGPLTGLYEDPQRSIDQQQAQNLGYDLAHFLRQRLV